VRNRETWVRDVVHTSAEERKVFARVSGHWDTAIWLHGPEHVKKEEIGAALANLEAVADNVVVMTPFGYMEQGVFRGNPAEEHVSAWVPEDFRALGYEAATRGRKDEAHATVLAWKRKE
jgi:hypothetical protein